MSTETRKHRQYVKVSQARAAQRIYSSPEDFFGAAPRAMSEVMDARGFWRLGVSKERVSEGVREQEARSYTMAAGRRQALEM